MKCTIAAFVAVYCSFGLAAQVSSTHEAIGAAGTELKGNSASHGTISFTVGEIGTQTHSSPSDPIIITEGFHQTYFLINEIVESPAAKLDVKVWPNPTVRYLNIELGENSNNPIIKAKIENLAGVTLYEFSPSEVSQIDLTLLPVSTYLLKIYNEASAQISVFQIIKH
ncbi:MAG: T9SS type A sorting domain-containing protein [Flavobacteriales bacterium]|nr:T9SS type A sorting domain-containing protein [Flavobacteriales bacterium]